MSQLSAMTQDELAAFETYIVDTCREYERVHLQDKGYRRCVVMGPNYFVKFDACGILWPVILTQDYIYQYTKSDVNAPRVPEILHFFRKEGMAYAVMECVNFTIPPVLETAAEKAAAALSWLSKVPAPPGHTRIGPLGNGCARHRLFKDNQAPLPFSSIEALERYLNKAGKTCRPRTQPIEPVMISHEKLIFIQSDMDPSKFGVDDEGKTVLLDFGSVGLLPESFAVFTMSSCNTFITAVSRYLNWPPSNNNQKSMAIIRGFLWMVSDQSLGLDEDGYPQQQIRTAPTFMRLTK